MHFTKVSIIHPLKRLQWNTQLQKDTCVLYIYIILTMYSELPRNLCGRFRIWSFLFNFPLPLKQIDENCINQLKMCHKIGASLWKRKSHNTSVAFLRKLIVNDNFSIYSLVFYLHAHMGFRHNRSSRFQVISNIRISLLTVNENVKSHWFSGVRSFLSMNPRPGLIKFVTVVKRFEKSSVKLM